MESTSHKPYVKYEADGNILPILAYETVENKDKRNVRWRPEDIRVPLVPKDGRLVRADEISKDYEIILKVGDEKQLLHG